MPVVSKAQNAAMHAAADGDSSLGIPKDVGQEFTSTPPASPLPDYVQAQMGHKAANRKAHRGRRGRGKGVKPAADLHAEAKTHMAAAQAAPTPQGAMNHLFKAVRSLHAAKQSQMPTL